jgi:para-nitrobenzyl esterase
MGNGGAAMMFDLDEAALRDQVAKGAYVSPDDADRLIALYRKNYPTASPARLFFQITTDRVWRMTAITVAERKSAQGKAPAFLYLWKWETPVLGGKFGAPHTIELPFVFHDVDNTTNSDTGTSKARYKLQDQAAGAWVAFARTGDPNHAGLPRWPAYDATTRPTMIFDTPCAVEDDPGREERLAIAAMPVRG